MEVPVELVSEKRKNVVRGEGESRPNVARRQWEEKRSS